MSGNTIASTDFVFPNQTGFYKGSVRDVYEIQNKYLVMAVTDRISAFDVILSATIPHKGQVLSQIAGHFLEATRDIVPNWFISSPDPNVVLGYKCEPYKIEVVVRGYLVGHAWREYQAGKRTVSGVKLPDGMRENEKFPDPIITPATHAEAGQHDEDISAAEIVKRGLVPADDWEQIESYALELFRCGSDIALKRGLILVDTKYEFGKRGGELCLMDEVHTPDSSRYFYADGYEARFEKGEHQRQLSKEFVREWLIEHGFQGLSGQEMPDIPPSFVAEISDRYIELYEQLTGKSFVRPKPSENLAARIESNIMNALEKL